MGPGIGRCFVGIMSSDSGVPSARQKDFLRILRGTVVAADSWVLRSDRGEQTDEADHLEVPVEVVSEWTDRKYRETV